MDNELEYLEAILKARISDNKARTKFLGIVFNYKSKREFYKWESTIVRGISGTCAFVSYTGVSDSPQGAFEDMCRRVRTDEKDPNEVG